MDPTLPSEYHDKFKGQKARNKMNMDLVALAAYGRPAVQPSASNPASVGIRQINDPREAAIPVAPLAARNSPDLRQSVGPRQSSSSGTDTREGEEHATPVRGRSGTHGTTSARSRGGYGEEGGDRGSALDVTV
jgi:hypothetical protein